MGSHLQGLCRDKLSFDLCWTEASAQALVRRCPGEGKVWLPGKSFPGIFRRADPLLVPRAGPVSWSSAVLGHSPQELRKGSGAGGGKGKPTLFPASTSLLMTNSAHQTDGGDGLATKTTLQGHLWLLTAARAPVPAPGWERPPVWSQARASPATPESHTSRLRDSLWLQGGEMKSIPPAQGSVPQRQHGRRC